ncbi:M16 family metallopeptidase [Leptospira sp. GIMC2001]|uniref:M16 family metallopeptidase n=1 Tax=Leptospira sp. GIMC2001 TaxID=1513297 RepID=UPI00234AB1B9|nr:pitrilysin family protein [Leptospira sp. GIMC2001]WCL50831.1 pitrilysin family protein [Leptospira sp. GIMC2001]
MNILFKNLKNHSKFFFQTKMIYFNLLVLIGLLLFGTFGILEANGRAMGEFVKDIKFPSLNFVFPKIERTKINNEAEILSLTSNEFPLTYMEFHFYSGDQLDLPLEAGPLLYGSWKLGGTSKFPDSKFQEKLEFLGAKINLSGHFEKVVLSISYLSRDEEEIFALLEDWLINPRLEERNVATVRKQLAEALYRRNDSVPGIGMRKAKEFIYGDHLRGKTEQLSSLNSVSIQQIKEFHSRVLNASKIYVTVSGDGNPSSLTTRVKSFLAKTSQKKSKLSKDVQYDDLLKSIKSKDKSIRLIDKETNQSMVLLTGIMPEHNHPDFYAIQVLNYILGGGGFNSYMMTEIRNNRGLAYSSASQISFERTHGVFTAYTLTKNESVAEVLSLMKSILSLNTVNNIKQDELVRAQNAIVNQFVFLFDSNKKILTNQVRFMDHDMPEGYLEGFRSKIESVSLDDLKRVGEMYFQPQNFRTIIVGPKSIGKDLANEKIQVSQPEDILR